MKIIIANPDQIREMFVEWIECMSTEGGYIIMTGHAPCVLQLAPHQVIALKLRQGAVKSLTVSGGVMSVTREKVILLLEDAV